MQKNTENTRKLQPHEYMYFGSQRVFDYVKNTILNGTPNEQRKMYKNLVDIIYHDASLFFTDFGNFSEVLYIFRLLPIVNEKYKSRTYSEISSDDKLPQKKDGFNGFLDYAGRVIEKVLKELPSFIESTKSENEKSRNAYFKAICTTTKIDLFGLKHKWDNVVFIDNEEEKRGDSFYGDLAEPVSDDDTEYIIELQANIVDCLVQLCDVTSLRVDKIIAVAFAHALTRLDKRKNASNKDIVEEFSGRTYRECAYIFIRYLKIAFPNMVDFSAFDCLFEKLEEEVDGGIIGDEIFNLTERQLRDVRNKIKPKIPAMNEDAPTRVKYCEKNKCLPKKDDPQVVWLLTFGAVLSKKEDIRDVLCEAIIKAYSELPLGTKKQILDDETVLEPFKDLRIGEAFDELIGFVDGFLELYVNTTIFSEFNARLNKYDKKEDCVFYKQKFIL